MILRSKERGSKSHKTWRSQVNKINKDNDKGINNIGPMSGHHGEARLCASDSNAPDQHQDRAHMLYALSRGPHNSWPKLGHF